MASIRDKQDVINDYIDERSKNDWAEPLSKRAKELAQEYQDNISSYLGMIGTHVNYCMECNAHPTIECELH